MESTKNKLSKRSEHKRFQAIKEHLHNNANAVQKLATSEHKKYLGGKKFRTEYIEKYQDLHVQIINEFVNNLDNKSKGISIFKKLGTIIATEAVNDDLTIKEALDGIIFLRQSIWKSLHKEKLMEALSRHELHILTVTVGIYSDVISSQIAITFHNHATQKRKIVERNLSLVLDHVKDYGIVWLDPKGNIIYWNNGAKKLFRYSEDEILGKNYSLFFAREEIKNRKPERELQSALKKGSVENENWSIRKDGSQFWASGITSSLYDPQKKLYGYVKIIRDRTEVKEIEKQKDEFVALVSHELKNPLTSLMAYSQLLQKRVEKTEDQVSLKAITAINTQNEKLKNLINNLLEKSRTRSKGFVFYDAEFDLDNLIHQTIDEIHAGKATHKIIYKNKDKITLFADRSKIGQLIYNIISNAIKYSPDSSKIIVDLHKQKKKAVISVQDFGMGISEKNIKKIFTPFFRATNIQREAFPSIGLGLFISSEIVKYYKGEIRIESTEGEGSTFYIFLPLDKIEN